MEKSNRIAVAVLAVAMVGMVYSCEDSPENVLNSGRNDNLELKTVGPGNDTPITILQIKRGTRKGKWPNQYCVGTKGVCILVFNKPGIIDFPFVEMYIDNGTMYFTVDFSKASNEEKDAWKADIEQGYVEFFNDIVLDDKELLEQLDMDSPITLPAGNYVISSVNGERFDFSVKF